MSRAYNLQNGNVGPSPFVRARGNLVAGNDPISDHFGLNAEIDDVADAMNPKTAYVQTYDYALRSDKNYLYFDARGKANKSAAFSYPTAVHWYKLTERGDYVFAVNSKDFRYEDDVTGPDNGVGFHVFENTELSNTISPFKGEVFDVPPTLIAVPGTEEGGQPPYSVPGYRQGKFIPASFPIWVKVFATDASKLPSSGRYLFGAKRLDCTTREEACGMLPYDTTLGDERDKAPSLLKKRLLGSKSGEAWFTFTLERPDSLGGQNVRLFVAEPVEKPTIDSVQVVDGATGAVMPQIKVAPTKEVTINGVSWRIWEYKGTHAGTLGSGPSDLGSVHGKKYYLRVLRLSSSVGTDRNVIVPGWQTSLTWMFGPALGGSASCVLKCNDTQEVGHDELWMSMQTYGRTTSSGPRPDNASDWPPTASGVEATNAVNLVSINETEAINWPPVFFSRINTHHPDGTSFKRVPAIGFTERFGIVLWEDDSPGKGDEAADARFDVDEFPLLPKGIFSGERTMIFEDDWDEGEYKLLSCNIAHYLEMAACSNDSECNSPLTCQAGVCRAIDR